MANELRMPHVGVAAIYMAVQAVVMVPGQGYACLGASIGVLSIIYVVFMKRYYGLHV